MRSGVVLPDPLLLLFPRADLTWLTFGLIYLALAVGLVNLCRFPESLVIAMQSYTLMTLARMAMMYAMPLDAPPGMIPLHDPFVEVVGTGRLLTKDLFFSGHASTMVLLSLTAPQRRTKFLFGLCAVLVGVFVLIQRVHYSADVLAAPVFSYLAYRVVVLAHLKAKDSSRIH